MAIYAPEIKIVGGGNAGARASASSWCDYVMRVGQYHEKDGFESSVVLLPENAPAEWLDPHALWAAVDAAAKQGDEQTGREFMLPLPREFNREQCEELATGWARENLVANGMAAHVVIHVNERGERHAHITGAMRRVNAKGELENKRITMYPVRRAGEERLIESAEWKDAKVEGWEKIYLFTDGKTRTKTECEAEGLSWKNDRVREANGKLKPLQSDRKATDWDTKDKMLEWRKSWEVAINKALDKYAPGTEHVDCRSYKERGIDKLPQVKLGAKVIEIERAEQERCREVGVAYEPITVPAAKNAAIEEANQVLANPQVPEHWKEHLKEEVAKLYQAELYAPVEAKGFVRPIVQRIMEGVEAAKAIFRKTIETALASPLCRTIVSFGRELMQRGIELQRMREDYRYSCGGYAYAGADLGQGYTRADIEGTLAARQELLAKRYQERHEADRERYGRIQAEREGRARAEQRQKAAEARTEPPKTKQVQTPKRTETKPPAAAQGANRGYVDLAAEIAAATAASNATRKPRKTEPYRGGGSIGAMGRNAEDAFNDPSNRQRGQGRGGHGWGLGD